MQEWNELKPIEEWKIELSVKLYGGFRDWKQADKTIRDYFYKNTSNSELGVVLTKVCLIDGLYRTNLYAPVEMARRISRISSLEERLNSDESQVLQETLMEVANWERAPPTKKRFFSFASKFCHFSAEEKFPIYDKYVLKALKGLGCPRNEEDVQRNFIDIVRKLKSHSVKYKEMDVFLWLSGQVLEIKEQKKKGKKLQINKEVSKAYDESTPRFESLIEGFRIQ